MRATVAAANDTRPKFKGTLHLESASNAKDSRKGARPPSGSTSQAPILSSTAKDNAPRAKRVSSDLTARIRSFDMATYAEPERSMSRTPSMTAVPRSEASGEDEPI
jgi:hypothetical protein